MKKKLTLDLDTLRVEQFEPSHAARQHGGTVNAHADDGIAVASMSYCEPCFTESRLCDPLTTYRCT